MRKYQVIKIEVQVKSLSDIRRGYTLECEADYEEITAPLLDEREARKAINRCENVYSSNGSGLNTVEEYWILIADFDEEGHVIEGADYDSCPNESWIGIERQQ